MTIAEFMNAQKTGYAIEASKGKATFVVHEAKRIVIANQSSFEQGLQCLFEIYLYQHFPDLFKLLYQENDLAVAKKIDEALQKMSLKGNIEPEAVASYRRHFISYQVCPLYDELVERERLQQLFDVQALCERAKRIIEKSGLSPRLTFSFQQTEEMILGTYGKFLGHPEIRMYIGNLYHSYIQGNHPYPSLTAYADAIVAHELGHMVREHPIFPFELDKKREVETFKRAFFSYSRSILREENGAWKESIRFHIEDIDIDKINVYKTYHLHKCILHLKKERTLLLKAFL